MEQLLRQRYQKENHLLESEWNDTEQPSQKITSKKREEIILQLSNMNYKQF